MANLKRLLVLSLIAAVTALIVACKSDGQSACEKLNDLCNRNLDCEALADSASDREDNATDEQKEASEKYYDCIDDAETCTAATACSGGTPAKESSGGADAGVDAP